MSEHQDYVDSVSTAAYDAADEVSFIGAELKTRRAFQAGAAWAASLIPDREEIAHALYDLPGNRPWVTDLDRLNELADGHRIYYARKRDSLYRQVDAVLALIASKK